MMLSNDPLNSSSPKKRRMMNGANKTSKPFKEQLAEIVKNLSKGVPIKFSFGGTADQLPTLPGLEVKGHGLVPFPMTKEIADKLIPLCTKAPYGKGLKTVTDEKVRKCWEIDAKKLTLKHPLWQTAIRSLVERVGNALGFEGSSVEAVLYKFLVYEKGGHFKKHRDTEKSPGMFATLLIQLPSNYKGGNLLVHHDGKTERYDFGQVSGYAPFKAHFAAHYSDVEHEVEKVTDGYRCMLAYNLCWKGRGKAPSFDTLKDVSKNIAKTFSRWNEEPKVLVFGLEHLYSDSGLNLGADSLKGHDAQLGAALKDVNEGTKKEDKLSLYIAKAERNVTSTGDYPGWRRHGSYSPNWDVCDNEESIEDWQTFDGTKVSHPSLLRLNLEQCFVGSNSDFNKIWGEAVERDEESYQGNYGPTLTEVFHKYIIVAVRKSRENEIIREEGDTSEIAGHAYNQSKDPQLTQEATENIEWLIQKWSSKADSSYDYMYRHSSRDNCPCSLVLKAIGNLKNASLLKNFIAKVISTNENLSNMQSGLYACLKKFKWSLISKDLLQLLEAASKNHSKACLQFVETLSGVPATVKSSILRAILPGVKENATNLTNDAILQLMKKVKQSLPKEVVSFTEELTKSMSVANANNCIKFIPDVTSYASMPQLLNAAFPGIQENITNIATDEICQFVALLDKDLPASAKDFALEVIAKTCKSNVHDSIKILQRIYKLKSLESGNVFDVVVPVLKEKANLLSVSEIANIIPVLVEALNSDRVNEFVLYVVRERSKFNVHQCLELVQNVKSFDVVPLTVLIETVLPRAKEKVRALSTADIIGIMKLLQNTSDISSSDNSLKNFTGFLLTSNYKSSQQLGALLAACEQSFGDSFLKREDILPLVKFRVNYLAEFVQKQKEFSWCMPKARFPGYHAIEAFFKGSTQRYQFSSGGGIAAARKWIRLHFSKQSLNGGFSADATAGGIGSGAFVQITKTRAIFESQVASLYKYQTELMGLQKITGEVSQSSA